MGLLDVQSLSQHTAPPSAKSPIQEIFLRKPLDVNPDGTFTRSGATATRFDEDGDLVTVAADVARMDYGPDGVFKGLLLEGASTNLLSSSNAWGGNLRTSTTANQAVAPTGETTMALITATESNVNGSFVQNAALSQAAGTYSQSVWARKGTGGWICLRPTDTSSSANNAQAWFDLDTGAVGTVGSPGTNFSAASARIKEWDGGLLECSITYTLDATVSVADRVYLTTGDATLQSLLNDTVFLWNSQPELSPFPTSPIISAGSATSRFADFLSAPFPYSWAEIYAAGEVSFRVEGREGGTHQVSLARLFNIGSGEVTAGVRGVNLRMGGDLLSALLLGNGGTVAGTGYVFKACTTRPAFGDDFVQTARITTRDNAGTREARVEEIRQWINGVESGSNTTPTGWISIEDNVSLGWQGSQTAYINSRDGGNNRGRGWFRQVHTVLSPGAFTFDGALPAGAVDLLRGDRYSFSLDGPPDLVLVTDGGILKTARHETSIVPATRFWASATSDIIRTDL